MRWPPTPLVPVLLCAWLLTPLLGDIFFVSMALAVMFGLTFATVLTLVIVPTFVATFYRVPSPTAGARAPAA